MSFTIQSLMEKMPAAFLPEKAAGLKAVIQFKFSGVEAGDWFITIQDGHCMVEKGIHPAPQMTLSADSADFIKVFSGELDPMQAFMHGKLKLSGDMSLAMKLVTLFKMR